MPSKNNTSSEISDVASKPDTAGHNVKNVQEVSKHGSAHPSRRSARSDRLPKTHAGYWKSRLFKNTYTRAGVRCQVNEWSVKIQHLGQRKTFALGTTNRDLAADKAKNLYVAIIGKGWETADAQFNPAMLVRKDDPTLGEFFTEVERKGGLTPKTFRNYTSAFRTIASGIFGLGSDRSKFDYRSGGRQKWLDKIDAIKLASITPDAVQQWKIAYIKAVGTSPVAVASAKRTVNSYVRCARSLFSRRILKFVKVRVPDPLPFDGIELEKSGSTRYVSRIDPQLLVLRAREELREKHPDAFKVFVLGLFCGLRRAEIDLLQWSAMDWGQHRVWIVTTEHFDPKTDDSEDFVEVDSEVMDEIRGWMKTSQSEFVISSALPPRSGTDRQYYRCQRVFKELTAWLRKMGISADKPLHELRKEFGSLVNAKYGIYAASRALRHSDITTSTRHYVAKKERFTIGLGHLLDNPAVSVVEPKTGTTD